MQLHRDPGTILVFVGVLGILFFTGVSLLFIYAYPEYI